jgi:hypothetical protein|tara:strand:- start:943 stop:1146 length:204 start_codon:yes stop_codon:yes gene_type:complete
MMELIIGAVVAIAAVFMAYIKGKSAANDKTEAKAAQARAATIERVKNADTGKPDGSDDVEWLRNRGK